MPERKKNKLLVFVLALSLGILLISAPVAQAQQTLGGITGTVMESTGSVLPGTLVTIVGDETTLTRTQTSSGNGSYDFVNLPIGAYTLTFTHDGFQTQRVPSILVQANRTATVNTTMQVGQVATTITVEETPLINSSDTTNGYILDREQIESIPLPTGSFTGLAILSRWGECRTAGRHRGQRRSGQSAHLGQRTTRYQQYLPAERSGCQQPVQRQEHQPGGFGAHCEQHRSRWSG